MYPSHTHTHTHRLICMLTNTCGWWECSGGCQAGGWAYARLRLGESQGQIVFPVCTFLFGSAVKGGGSGINQCVHVPVSVHTEGFC